MNDKPPASVPPDQAPPSERVILAPSPFPLAPRRTANRLARLLNAGFAWLRALLRHPLRNLMVAALLLLIAAGGGIAGVWLWASYHLRLGRAALERYHTAEAVPHLQAVLAVWPHDAETLLLAARAARRAAAFEDADRFLDLYQQRRGEDKDLTLERVCVRAERGEPDSVATYCRALIAQNHPASAVLYEALARGYHHSYQPHKAEKVLQEWLEQEPDNPQAFLLQGQVYDLELRYADAVQSFRTALMADPSLDEARFRLCDALMQLGSMEEAQPHLEYLRGRLPNNLKVLVYLARIEDHRGNSEEAERILQAVLDRQPRFAPALVERGNLVLRARRYAEAEKWLRQAVQLEPSDHQAHHQLAFCLEQMGKLAEADKEYQFIKQMEKDMQEIQALVNGKMEAAPHNADLHYRIGMISLRAGAVKEALRWLHSALREDPNHQGAHKALMEYYQRIHDYGRANEHRHKLTK